MIARDRQLTEPVECYLVVALRNHVAVERRLQVEPDRLHVGDVVGDEQLSAVLPLLLPRAAQNRAEHEVGRVGRRPAHAGHGRTLNGMKDEQ